MNDDTMSEHSATEISPAERIDTIQIGAEPERERFEETGCTPQTAEAAIELLRDGAEIVLRDDDGNVAIRLEARENGLIRGHYPQANARLNEIKRYEINFYLADFEVEVRR